jgi:hypothetical protein
LVEGADVHAAEVGDVLAVDEEVERLAVEASASAFGACGAAEPLAAPFLGARRCVVGLLHLDVFEYAFVGEEVVGGGEGGVGDLEPLVGAVEYVGEGFFRQFAHGCGELVAVFLADGFDLPEYHRVAIFAERGDASVADG